MVCTLQTLFQRLQDYQAALPEAAQPRYITTGLLPYQRQALHWMKLREVGLRTHPWPRGSGRAPRARA